MKVAVVTQFPVDPAFPQGGVEAVCVNLVQALSNYEDLELHVVTVDPTCSEPVLTDLNGVVIHRLPRLKGRTLTHAIGPGRKQILAYVQGLAPDVVHAHDTYGLMVKGLKLPWVLTIHGFISDNTRVSGERWAWPRSLLWRFHEQAGWAEAPHIISINPYVRARVTGVATGSVHDIENPVSDAFFDIHRNEKKGVVFSAAAISPLKNTLMLLKAVHRLAAQGVDVTLRLAGRVQDPHYGKQLEALIEQYALRERVVLLGQVGRDQIMEELTRASVFALVSLDENAPMSIEEAMAAGVPVVASNRCGMPYMVDHDKTGYLVDPLDVEDISTRLKHVITHDQLRRDMSEASRRKARSSYQASVVARKTRDVYGQAAGQLDSPPDD